MTSRNTHAGLALVGLALAACSGSPSPVTTVSIDAPTDATTDARASVSGSVRTGPATSTAASSPTPSPAATSASPSSQVVSAHLSYGWHWPGDPAVPGTVTHGPTSPSVPQLLRIGVGRHPGDPGQPPFERLSFTFSQGFPSYHFDLHDTLVGDAAGQRVPLRGDDVLRIVFQVAQAHTDAVPTTSSILTQPARPIGYSRIADYAQGGDFEGYLTYGIGITRAVRQSAQQYQVRASEFEQVAPGGQHLYVVAFDVDTR